MNSSVFDQAYIKLIRNNDSSVVIKEKLWKGIKPHLFIEQKQVAFYGDELTAIKTNDGQVYVSVRHMCDALGLSVQAQTRRIHRQEVLADGFMVAKMATIKGEREASWLRADMIPLWLTGVSVKSVKEEITKLKRFQKEAARVLWEAFQEGRLTTEPEFDELLQVDSDAVQAYQIALAVVKLARQQILMEARLTGRLDDHEYRLEQIELTLGDPGRFVTPSQAMQVSQAVKAVALEIGKKSGRNEHGSVYGQLYRQFEVTSYKQLPAERFQEAMDWLTDWYKRQTGGFIKGIHRVKL
jgi:hypothetical protein